MIRVTDLNKTYDAGRRHANRVLRDVSLTLPDTGFVCIVGPSGCGKTSLLNAIGGLDSFDSGTIATGAATVSRSGSRELERERNNSFGYIFQNYYLLSDHSVAYNVYLGLHALELSHREKSKRVREALKAVNMERYERRIVSDLSGGQQQRVAIARALVRRPRVIFADEPTGNLDEENTVNICTLLHQISKTSLVVMVTHEESIARFFADRIITLGEGKVVQDSDSWERGSFRAPGSGLYAGDFEEGSVSADGLELRLLREKGAEPVKVTLAVLHDRIILKLDDGRTVSCSTTGEDPVIHEGKRPELLLEMVDSTPAEEELPAAPSVPARAGRGLTLSMMMEEARLLLRGKGMRFITTWIFLAAMAVLTTFMVSDYLTVSSVDPEDFIITDSHILEFSFERGPSLPATADGIRTQVQEFLTYLSASGLDYDFIPYVSTQLRYSNDALFQLGVVSESLGSFSHALIDRLDESDLIYGRMPEKSDEIVVDRWVLDAFLEEDGILQSGIPQISDMLGRKLEYFKLSYAPTIVGICDCGDPTIYITRAGMASVGRLGSNVIPLSELRELCPGEYDDVVLGENECLVIYNNAGDIYKSKVGSEFNLISREKRATIVDAIEADTWAHVVISDEALDTMLRDMCTVSGEFMLYCTDKQTMKNYLADGLPESLQGLLLMEMEDAHGSALASYKASSRLKADARTIVTVTVIALCIVMLYLLRRSGVQQRIGMMAVYRLLGIPKSKLLGIFAMESLIATLTSVLPATVLTWAVIQILNALPSLEFSMILPLGAAAVVFVVILIYYLLVSLLPTLRLLSLPPARLAAKYDL